MARGPSQVVLPAGWSVEGDDASQGAILPPGWIVESQGDQTADDIGAAISSVRARQPVDPADVAAEQRRQDMIRRPVEEPPSRLDIAARNRRLNLIADGHDVDAEEAAARAAAAQEASDRAVAGATEDIDPQAAQHFAADERRRREYERTDLTPIERADMARRAHLDADIQGVFAQAPPEIQNLGAYAATVAHNLSPRNYPFLYRNGGLLTPDEIGDFILRNQDRVHGMAPAQAMLEIFGRADMRPSRSSPRPLGTPPPAGPRFQADPLNSDTETNARGEPTRDRRGFNDFGPPHALVPEQADTWGQRLSTMARRFGDSLGETFGGFIDSALERGNDNDASMELGSNRIIHMTSDAAENMRRMAIDNRETWMQRATESLSRDLENTQYHFSPGALGTADSYLTSGVDSFLQMAPVLATAFATRGESVEGEAELEASPTGGPVRRALSGIFQRIARDMHETRYAMSTLATQTYGQQYAEARHQGLTPGGAGAYASMYALAETLPESMPLESIMRPGGRILPRYLRSIGFEGASEMLTQVVESAYDSGTVNPNMTWSEAWGQIRDAGIVGSLMGVGMGGAGHIVDHARGGEEGHQRDQALAELDQSTFAPTDVNAAATQAMDPNAVDPRTRIAQSPLPRRGIRETAAAAPAPVTQQDEASPLPTDLIAEGKGAINQDLAGQTADNILQQYLGMRSGDRIALTLGDQTHGGTMLDAFQEEDPETGTHHGAVIGWDDGSTSRERFADLHAARARIEPHPNGNARQAVINHISTSESGGDPNAHNRSSTASGEFQMLDGTFRHYYQQVYGRDPGAHPDPAVKNDRATQRRLMNAMMDDYEAALRRGGHAITPGNLYLNHFLGTGGANTILNHPDTPIESLVPAAVIRANRFLAGMTGADVAAWAAHRMGGPVAPGSASSGGTSELADQNDAPDFSWTEHPQDITSEALPGTTPEPAATAAPIGTLATGETGPAIGAEPTGDGTRANPMIATTAEHVDQAATNAAQPTEGQAEAGNYQKGHVRVQGLDITIENARGSERSGVDPNGEPWTVQLPATYGYVKRTEGQDGEQVDVYVGPHPTEPRVYVIDQVHADTGAQDEHKAMIGFPSQEAALATYHQAFSDGRGPERVGAVTPMDMSQFKDWLKSGDTQATAATAQLSDITGQQESAAFDPEPHVEAMRQHIANSSGSLNDMEKLGKKLGLSAEQANRVLGVVASRPNSGIRMTKGRAAGVRRVLTSPARMSGGKQVAARYKSVTYRQAVPARFQRVGTREAPLHLMEWVRQQGGVKSGRHDLRNVGALARHPGVINNKTGLSLDQLGERMHEAGWTHERPTEADVIAALDHASTHKVYRPGEEPQTETSTDEQASGHEATARSYNEEFGLNLDDDAIARAVEYMGEGKSIMASLTEAGNDMAVDAMEAAASESGNDDYLDIPEEAHGGIQPGDEGQSDQGAAESGARSEGEQGNAGEGDQSNARPNGAGENDGEIKPAIDPLSTLTNFGLLKNIDERYRIAREKAVPVLDLHKAPTGWRELPLTNRGAPQSELTLIISSTKNESKLFEGRSAAAEAQAYAIDNPQFEAVGQGPAPELISRSLFGESIAEPASKTEKPAEPATPDMFGTRPGDERAALEKKGEGRKKGTAPQKAPGSDGGLLDQRDTTGDLTQPESSDPVEKAKAALQSALDVLNGKTTEAPVAEAAPAETPSAPVASEKAPAIDTPAFKAWFGDSKVTDEDGNPQVVYHGTHAEIEAFDRMASAKRFGQSFNNLGLWFTNRHDGARTLYGPKTVAAYLSIQKPMMIYGHETRAMATARNGLIGNDAAWNKFWKLWDKLTDPESSTKLNAPEPQRTAVRDPEPMRQWLKEHGYDGIIMRNTFADSPSHETTPQDFFIALEPGQIKSTDNTGAFNPADDRIRYQRRLTEGDDPVFYSALDRAVAASPTARASADQWAATLSKAAGVKKEELEWSGVFDWLDMQKGPVSREDLLGVIRDGGIKVEETVLGEPSRVDPAQLEKATREQAEALANHRLPEDATDEDRQQWINDHWGEIQDEQENMLSGEGENATQFNSWNSDSNNPTYRELLITLPVAQGGNPSRAPATHWEQEAVVAHTRFMDKTDANGRRVLFVDEIQSDWHQKGRDEGYGEGADPASIAAAEKAVEEAEAELKRSSEELTATVIDALEERARLLGSDVRGESEIEGDRQKAAELRAEIGHAGAVALGSEAEEVAQRYSLMGRGYVGQHSNARTTARLRLNEAQQALGNAKQPRGIPNAPFKASWPALVMKRVIRWAVDHGYERVAWTTGDQQNERYNLERHIGAIDFSDNSTGGIGNASMEGPPGRGMVRAWAPNNNRQIFHNFIDLEQDPKALENLIGPELAARLLASEPRPSREAGLGVRTRSLEGLNLRTGGEGMRGFYDRNLVNITNDLIKKSGGKVDVGGVIMSPLDVERAERQLSSARKQMESHQDTINRWEEFQNQNGKSQVGDQTLAETKGYLHASRNRIAEMEAALRDYKLGEPQPGFDITPALADAARSGFPLFQRAQSSPVTEAEATRIAERLQQELDRLGISDRIALKAANGLLTEKTAQGSYFRRVIQVSLDMAINPEATVSHESIHAMRALGLFTTAEWSALKMQALTDPGVREFLRKGGYATLGDEKRAEEAVAEFYARWRSERMNAKGFAAKAFQRLLDFLHALGRAVGFVKGRGLGAGTVLRRIEAGRIGARETGAGLDGAPRAFAGEVNAEPLYQNVSESRLKRNAFPDANIEAAYLAERKGGPARPNGMNIGDYDLFARKIMLDNLSLNTEGELPYGFTPETLAAAQEKTDALVTKIADVSDAVRKYNFSEMLNEVAKDATPEMFSEAQQREAVKGEPPRAANIRIDKLESTEDIKTALEVSADKFAGFGDSRRGVVSHEQTQALADDLDMTVDELTSRRRGQAFNAHELLAARQLLVSSADDLVQKATKADGGSDADLVAFRKAWVRHVAIQDQVSGMTAEAGRALNQFKMVARAGGDINARMMKEIINTEGGRSNIEDFAKAILGFSTDPAKMNSLARKAYKPTWRDKLFELWINGLLSGPATHVVNTVSNTLTMMTQIPEFALAAGIGKVSAVLTKSETDRILKSEVAARTFAMWSGVREGSRLAYDAIRSGEGSDVVSKLEARTQRAISGLKGEIIRTPSRLLVAMDELYKGAARHMDLAAQAAYIATNEGLTGDEYSARLAALVAHPTDEMTEKAMDFARYSTFQRPLGPIGQSVSQVINKIPGMRLIVPFMRTPANIFKYAIARTPLAPVMSEIRAELKAGGRSRDLAISRILMGTAIGAVVMMLAAAGIVTGGDPKDDDTRRLLHANGWQPYSIKIGDTYYSYSRLDPLSTIIGLAADLTMTHEDMSEAERSHAYANLFMSVVNQLKNKTFLSGIGSLIEAIEDTDRFGPSFLGRLAGSVVPAGVAQLNSAYIDPVQRDARSILERVESRIPGLSRYLPERRDIWGRPIVREGGVGPDIASPISTTTARNDPVTSALLRAGVNFDVPGRKVSDVELTPEEHDRYQELAGQVLHRVSERLVNGRLWNRLNDDDRVELFDRVKNRVRREVREHLGLTKHRLEREQAIRDSGGSPT